MDIFHENSILNVLRDLHTSMHGDYIRLTSPQHCTMSPISQHSWQHLLQLKNKLNFHAWCQSVCPCGLGLYFAGGRWNYLLPWLIYIFFFRQNICWCSWPALKLCLFLPLNSKNSLFVLGIGQLSVTWLANILSHCLGSLYTVTWFLCWIEASWFDITESLHFYFCWLCS